MIQREENRNLFQCHFVHRKGYMIYYYYYYYYYYHYLLQLSFWSLAVVLTLVQTKQIINIHKRNNTKTHYML